MGYVVWTRILTILWMFFIVRFKILIIRQKANLGCLQAAYAHDYLLAISINELGQHISIMEYRTILRCRLITPQFHIDAVCLVCHKACLNTFGEHAVHCKELSDFKYKHDFVRDVVFNIFRWAGVSVKRKAPVNFMTDPLDRRLTLWPAYVMVYG